MKKIITLLIACAAITAHAQIDSISTLISFQTTKSKQQVETGQQADNEPHEVLYPYLTPISSYEELSQEVMQLQFSKADAAAAMYKARMPIIQIMKTLGVKSNRTIYKYLQQKGVKVNRK